MGNDSWFKTYIIYLQRKYDFQISQLFSYILSLKMAKGDLGLKFPGLYWF